MPPHLIILKSPAPSVSEDKYTTYITSHGGDTPSYVAPLSSSLVPSALTTLRASFSSLEIFLSSYSGLILTSQRAVEALSDALTDFPASESSKNAPVPLFVVGPATGTSAETSTVTYGFPTQILGASSGTAAALALHILQHFATTRPTKPLLYLVGETHDPAFAATLRAGAVPVQELVVYATQERAEFGSELHAALRAKPLQDEVWIVACAPSGLSAMMRALGWVEEAAAAASIDNKSGARYDAQKRKSMMTERGFKINVAAIGPKTETFARTTFGFEVDGVAHSPTPEGIWNAVMKAIASSNPSSTRTS